MTGLALAAVYRFGQCALDRPTTQEAVAERAVLNTRPIAPVHHAQRVSVECDTVVLASVSHLCGASRPFAVVGRVGAIIVDAFKRVALRRTPIHVSQKTREVSTPCFAYNDASRAISAIARGVRVMTSLNSVLPDGELWQMTQSMCAPNRGYVFDSQAPARFRPAARDWMKNRRERVAARASAAHLSIRATADDPRGGLGYDGEASEGATGYVGAFHSLNNTPSLTFYRMVAA